MRDGVKGSCSWLAMTTEVCQHGLYVILFTLATSLFCVRDPVRRACKINYQIRSDEVSLFEKVYKVLLRYVEFSMK